MGKGDYSLSRHRLVDFDYTDPDHAIFVTVCARHGSPFTDARLADSVVASLQWLRESRGFIVYAHCLMPDHLHVLCRLGDCNQTLGVVIGSFKSFTTRQSWSLGFDGVLWQERFYDHIVRRSEDGQAIARYILENPVRKGLVADAEAYAWSGTSDPL
jgi:putative transposase